MEIHLRTQAPFVSLTSIASAIRVRPVESSRVRQSTSAPPCFLDWFSTGHTREQCAFSLLRVAIMLSSSFSCLPIAPTLLPLAACSDVSEATGFFNFKAAGLHQKDVSSDTTLRLRNFSCNGLPGRHEQMPLSMVGLWPQNVQSSVPLSGVPKCKI